MRLPEFSPPVPLSVPATLSEGTALGVWRLGEALHVGSGGRGCQWYRARHALAADRFSLVLVLPRNERSAGVLLRFGDQVGELGQLSLPAITVPTDSGVTAAGQPYLTLDWNEGQPILSACAQLPLRERLLLLVQLCEVLRAAHQQGWLLGEMDPAMLWVDEDQHLTLMGLGVMPMPDPSDPYERGTSLGTTPGYMSLELMAGAPPSLSSEVYGLGALLCMLVDGRLPSERGAGVDDVSRAAAWPGLTALEQLSLDALLHKAASPLIAQRHVSAEALADDLRAWLAGVNHSALALTPMPLPGAGAAKRPAFNTKTKTKSKTKSKSKSKSSVRSFDSDAWDGERPAWPTVPAHGRRLASAAFALAALLGAASWADLALFPVPGEPGLKLSGDIGARPALVRPDELPDSLSVLSVNLGAAPASGSVTAGATVTVTATAPITFTGAAPRQLPRSLATPLKLAPLIELPHDEAQASDSQPPVASKDERL